MQPLEGYQVERAGSHAVALELELDDALRREGLAREIVHAIQNARKAAGLDVSDRIALDARRRRASCRRRDDAHADTSPARCCATGIEVGAARDRHDGGDRRGPAAADRRREGG